MKNINDKDKKQCDIHVVGNSKAEEENLLDIKETISFIKTRLTIV